MNQEQRQEVCEYRAEEIDQLCEDNHMSKVDLRLDALDTGLAFIQAHGKYHAWSLGLAQSGNEEQFREQMEEICNGIDLSHLDLRGLVRLYDTIHDTDLRDKVDWVAVENPEHEISEQAESSS